MRIGSNRGELNRSQELNYLLTWFTEFSEMQKDDFFKILVNKYGGSECCNDDNVMNGFCGMELNDRPPSIFKCRMKLFNEWFANWSDEEKQEFLTRIKNVDEEFMENFRKAVDNPSAVNGETNAVNGNVEKEDCTTACNGDA